MEEQLISFETAKLAKEKGLPQDNFYFEDYEARVPFYGLDNELNKGDEDRFGQCKSISQSLLQKWLREKYDIDICIIKEVSIYLFVSYNVLISDSCNSKYRDLIDLQVSYTSYEEALEFALLRALKLINNEG